MKKHSIHFTVSFLLCALFAPIAMAQNAAAIEEIEVLGSKQAERSIIDVDLSTYNGFENIIDRSEFENRLVDIGDIINNSVSAQVRKNSGFGGYSSFSIRGSTGKQVNLYIDGMLLNSPQSGYSNLSIVPTSIVEQIEIYPDFSPAQLNDANIGGAINVRTRKPQKAFGGRVAASYGSFNTQQQDLDLWGGNDQTSAIVAISHASSDNDYPIDRDVICNDMTCGSSKKREHAAYDNYSLISKVQHQFDDTYSLHVLLGSSKSNNEVPHRNNRKSHKADLKNELHQFNVLFQGQHEAIHWGLRTYANQQREHFRDKTGTLITGGGSNVKQKQESLGLNNFTEFHLGQHILGLNLDYSDNKNHTKDNRKDDSLTSKREKLSAALSENWQVVDWLTLNAVVRANYIKDTSETPINSSNGARCKGSEKDCLQNSKLHTSWQTGAQLNFSNWTIKANIGEMIRIPTLTERFGETGAFLGNANLKPEKSKNYDLGVIFDNSRTLLQATVFYKELTDGIFTLFDARGVGHALNISKTELWGVELLARQKLGQYITIYYSGQWMDSENKANDVPPSIRGKKLYGFYHLNQRAGLTVQSDNHHWDINYQIDDDLYHNASNTRKAKSRKLLNTAYTWHIQAFSINVSLNNLLDHRYDDFGFMPAVGRSYTTTLSYNF